MHPADAPGRGPSRGRWLAAVLLVLTVAACANPTPSPPPGLRPSPPSAPDTPFPTGALDPALGWQRIDLTGVASPHVMSSVIVAGGQFLAVGQGGDLRVEPIVLASADALNWHSERITSDYAGPSQLAAVGDGVVAVGAGQTSRCAHPFGMDSWSRGADGRWTEAPWDAGFCNGLDAAHLLAWRSAAWLIASGSGDQPFDWSSLDGRHWIAEGNAGGIQPTAVVVDRGALLAFGRDDSGAVVARQSSDGVHWTSAPMAAPSSETLLAAFARPSGLQVLLDHAGRLDVLTRDPGGVATMTPATGMDSVEDGGTVIDVGDRLVRLAHDPNQLPVGWSSVDGITWTPIQLPDDSGPGTTLTGVAAEDGTAVLVGQTANADGSGASGAIWVGSELLLGS